MILDISEQSKQDVREIALYIAEDNRNVAIQFLDQIETTYGLLLDFPDIGHVPIFDFVDGLRTILVKEFKHYHIYYRVSDDTIRIERVANGNRDMPALFEYQKNMTP